MRQLHLLLGFAALLLGSAEGLSQTGGPGGGSPDQRGGGRGFPGGGGRGFGGFGDPNQFFNQMSGGKDVWLRAETDPRMQRMFDRIAAQLGITNGQITRQQYTTYQEQRAAQRQQGMSPGVGRGATTAPTAESMFALLDKNGDGLLNYDEMPEQLRAERERWDTDRNGFIDLSEFKAYFEARVLPPSTQSQSSSTSTAIDPQWQSALLWDYLQAPAEEARKPPVVYRAGNLPKDLPTWFEQLDTDKDGQIGLYEWKASGKSLQEFDEMDRNRDGFLTIDEVLRFVNKGKENGGQPGMQLGYAGNGNFPGNGGDFGGGRFFRGGGPGFGGPGGPGGGRPDRGPGGRGGRGRGGPGGGRDRGGPGGGNGRGGPDSYYNYNYNNSNYND